MISIFLKLFFAGIGIFFLWFFSKKALITLSPLWRDTKHLKQLQHLIDQSAYDKQTVQRAVKFYLPPKCQTIPPPRNNRPKERNSYKRRDLTQAVTQFIEKETSCRHLLILADPGMGKTSFALNYYLQNRKRYSLFLIPLNLKSADEMIDSVPEKNKAILFLDGLDEDVTAFQNPLERFVQLMEKAKEFKQVIITSSLNFIPRHKFIARQKEYDVVIAENKRSNRMYRLKRIYLPQLSLTRAQNQLGHLLPFWKNSIKKRILKFIHSNSSGITSLTLSYLPQILPKKPALLSKNMIYKNIIAQWLEQQHQWQDKKSLNLFLRKLAANLFLKRFARGEECIQEEELDNTIKGWGTSLKPFQKDINTLLGQTPSGHLRFTHRSVMEYLFIQQLLSGDKSCYQAHLTHGMKEFLFEALEKGQNKKLGPELEWLSGFEFKAQGLKLKSKEGQTSPSSLLKALLNKNTQYSFLNRLPKLFQNPIFSEFGWDPLLLENLNLAVSKSKSSFMKQKKTRQNILIDSKKIEITKPGRKTRQIPIKKNYYNEYARLQEDETFIKFCSSFGLEGLRMIYNINRSKRLAVLPDMESFRKFTLFFWRT